MKEIWQEFKTIWKEAREITDSRLASEKGMTREEFSAYTRRWRILYALSFVTLLAVYHLVMELLIMGVI